MEKLIAAFPANIKEALTIASNTSFKSPSHEVQNIIICGMGGSGIGGRLVAKWVEDELTVPVNVVSDYMLPKFVSKNSLVIGSSYSGNTEETISAIEEAVNVGAHIIGICSGGRLEQLCSENGFDFVKVPGGNPPRTALAYSITQLLNVFVQFNLISKDRLEELNAARKSIISEEQTIKAEAHKIAGFLKGNVGILYGTTKYDPVLVRARQQFNENSKLLCWHHALPEMNHNELVGWGGGDERFATLFFTGDDLHRRNAKRLEITMEIIRKKSSKVMEVRAKGESAIERSLYLINIVDWASLYLSELKGVDPIDIEVIDYLKNELANFS